MSESGPEEAGRNINPDLKFYTDLARSFLRNNDIPMYPENIFKAEVLLQICGEETGTARISAVKVLLEWGGQLKRRAKDENSHESRDYHISEEEALKTIFRNLKEMGITRGQAEKWMS